MPELNADIIIVFSIIIFTVVLFISEWVRVDAVACLVLILLGLTKLVSNEQLFTGFSSDAVVSIIGIMIIGAGLEKTGVMSYIAQVDYKTRR